MLSNSIILKKSPKIEFQLYESGFQIIDDQNVQNCGFYQYNQLQSIELNRAWFPRISRWMRIVTALLSGVPFFPDPDSYKFSSLKLNLDRNYIGMWITDIKMADKARLLKQLLDKKLTL